MRAVILIAMMTVTMTVMSAVANAQGSPPDRSDQGFFGTSPPVPPLSDQAVIGNYCIHRNLIYSIGDVRCESGQGVVCVPPTGTGSGSRAYWSSVPVSRGDVNWAPPAHCAAR